MSRPGSLTCGDKVQHRGCVPSDEEKLVNSVISALSGLVFEQACERSSPLPKPDYRSVPSGDRAAVEVKRLTSGAMQRHNAHSERFLDKDDPFHSVPTFLGT